MKKAIEWLIFNGNISRYQISKETGIAQSTLSDYANGKTDIGRMPLDTAETLYNYFKEVLSKMGHDPVVFEGTEVFLTQDPYIDGTHESPYYRAHAIDLDGNQYHVYWDVIDGWQQMDDAADHCDWDSPREVVAL